jgi:hypothetical protein
LNDNLLGPTIRLFESPANPRDAAMLGDAIVDEIYSPSQFSREYKRHFGFAPSATV